MIKHTFKDIYNEYDAQGAILNEEFSGFREDYLLLHCLLAKYRPKKILEIGTNMGTGTQIIKNAVPEADVYSLDLPTELAHISLQHPISEGKGDSVGSKCSLPYTQLRGDSLNFDYSSLPKMDAWFIDGEHDMIHVSREASEAINMGSWLIIFHDADMQAVQYGIADAFYGHQEYVVHIVEDTRIAYALKMTQ